MWRHLLGNDHILVSHSGSCILCSQMSSQSWAHASQSWMNEPNIQDTQEMHNIQRAFGNKNIHTHLQMKKYQRSRGKVPIFFLIFHLIWVILGFILYFSTIQFEFVSNLKVRVNKKQINKSPSQPLTCIVAYVSYASVPLYVNWRW